MKENVPDGQAATTQEELPPRVQEALGEFAGAGKDGLLAWSVGVRVGVFTELAEEEEVGEVAGTEGKHDPAAPRSVTATIGAKSRSAGAGPRSSLARTFG